MKEREQGFHLSDEDPQQRSLLLSGHEAELAQLREENAGLKAELARARETVARAALLAESEHRERVRTEVSRFSFSRNFTNSFDRAPVPVTCLTPDGFIDHANYLQLEFLGYPKSEYVNHLLKDFLPDEKLFGEILQATKGGDPPRNRASWMRCRNGTLKPVRISCATSNGGGGGGICCFIHDLSELERTRSDRRRTDLLFRELAEHIREVFWMTTPDKSSMLYVSPVFEEVWGRTRDSLYAEPKSFLDAIHPDDRERVIRALPLQEVENGYCQEYRVVRPDQSICWVRDRAFPVRDEQGNVYRIAGLTEDITERKQAAVLRWTWAKHQEVLARIGWLALTEPSLDQVFQETAERLADGLDIEYIEILEFRPQSDDLLLRAGIGWRPGRVGHATVGSDRDSQAGFTLFGREPVIVSDLRTEERFTGSSGLLDEHGVVSGLSVVIEGRDRPFGVLGIHSRQHRTFTIEDVNFLQTASHMLAAAIERRAGEERQRDLSVRLACEKDKLDRLLGTVPLLVWELRLDPVTGQLHQDYVSGYATTMLGYTGEELAADPLLWQERLHPDDLDKVNEEMAEVLAGRHPPPVQFRWIAPDDRIVWIESTKQLVKDEAGKPTGLRGFALDITARKAEEVRRQKAEDRFFDMIQNIPGVVWELSLEPVTGCLTPVFISDYIETLLGYPKEKWMASAQFWIDSIFPEDRDRVEQTMTRVLSDGKPALEHFRWVASDGRILWVESRKRAIRDETGKPVGIRGVTVDITEQKLAADERAAAEERFHAFMDHSPAMAVMKDAEGRFVYGNAAFESWCDGLGLQWRGANNKEVFPEEAANRYDRHDREAMEKGETTQVLETTRDKDGAPRYWNVLRFPVESSGGRFLGLVAIDITERRRLEHELLEISDREQSRLGQELHDGLAQHILGIALMSKTLSGRMRKMELPEAEDVETITAFLDEALAVTRGLMQGFHLVNVEGPGGLPAALEEFAETTSKLFGKNCRFESTVSIRVNDGGVAAHLFRIAQEATHNAIKHGGPTLVTIGLSRQEDTLELTVENDGKSLPEGVSGRGMGMRTMNYRASLIGADLHIENRPGGGVVVTCSLPSGPGHGIEFME